MVPTGRRVHVDRNADIVTESSTPRPTSLTARTVRGVAWMLPMSLGSRVLGLVGTLLLTRWLLPAEYGEVTAAAIVTTTAFGVTTFGIGMHLMSNRDLGRAEIFHATCWFLTTGIVALAIVWGASGLLGGWLDAPHLARFMPLFVLSTLLDRLFFLPERMLLRQLRFRWLSLSRASGELTYTAASLVLAALGFGAMSIAWAYLARATVRFLSIVPAVHWREWLEPHPLRREVFRKIIRSGMSVSITSVAAFLLRRWDNLLVTALFGNATMGAYNYAYNLADTPAVAIGEQMSDVVSASFPHAEGAKRRAALVRACTMISLIMFPLAFGLGAVAQTVVEALFDPKWASVGPMLMILAVLSAPRPLAQIVGSYFYAGHRMRVVPAVEWASLIAMVAGIETIGRLGIDWTCGVVGVVFVLRTLALMWMADRLDGIPLRSFLLPLLRPAVVCVAMVVAIAAARPSLHGLSPLLQLVIEVALGAAVYLAGASLVFRADAVALLRMIRSSARD